MLTVKKDIPPAIATKLENGEEKFTYQCPDCPFTTEFVTINPRVWMVMHLHKGDDEDMQMVVWRAS